MIKHVLKIIWNQRRSNSWIFAELLVVVAVLWVMLDSLLVNMYTYYSPLGFDIEHVYKVNIGKMGPATPGYVADSLKTSSDGEDLVRLVENLRQAPEVEETCIASVSCPYTWSNSWSSLIQAEADTSMKADAYQRFVVTPSYFDVLRMKSEDGQDLRQAVEQNEGDMVISADMEKRFFAGQPGKGRQVKWSSTNENSMTIAAVSTSVRQNEYDKSEPCFYLLLRSEQDMVDISNDMMAQNMDCLVRMKEGFHAENLETFLQKMSDRLTVNNIYVSSVTPLDEMRSVILKSRQDNMKKKLALVGFMLANVFFGIIGTFWVRTQYRRSEMGLRIAVGSSRNRLKRFMDMEGLSLLILTLPLIIVFIVNVLYFDLPDTVRLPYTWWRCVIALGGAFLLLGIMIVVGIWFPARRVAKMNPAEALHYE